MVPGKPVLAHTPEPACQRRDHTQKTRHVRHSSRRVKRPAPRQRLLTSATHLFTTQGIRVIGIDRILKDADVAKASLYSLFGSKDNLVVACLEQLSSDAKEQWYRVTDPYCAPEDKILAFFDIPIDEEPLTHFRGSHFHNAAREYPFPETESERAIRDAALRHRLWCEDTIVALLEAMRVPSSSVHPLMTQIMVLLDGGLVGATMAQTVQPLIIARALARQLLECQ